MNQQTTTNLLNKCVEIMWILWIMCQVNGSLNFFMLLPEEVKILDSKKKILFCQKKKKINSNSDI